MSQAEPDPRVRSYALWTATAAAFLVPFMGSAIPVAIPAIGRSLDASAVTLNWILTAYLIGSAALVLPLGRLADIAGRRRVFLGGMGVYAAGSVLAGLAPDIGWLLAGRVVQGFGAAGLFATSVAILTSVFPPSERGRVIGINVSAVYLGLALGPTLGGLVTDALGWRWVFLLNGAVAVPVMVLAVRGLRGEWYGGRGERFDSVGSVLLAVGFAGFTWGISALGTSAAAPFGAGAAILLLGAFVRWELRSAHPVLDVRLFASNRGFTLANLAALINYAATFAVGYLVSLRLQVGEGWSPRDAGLVLLAQPVTQAIGSPFAGRLSDRFGPRGPATAGMLVCTAGLALLAPPPFRASLPLVIGVLVLLGIGFALFSAPNTSAVMGAVPPRLYGVASSTVAAMRLVGMTASMAVVSLLFARNLGEAKLDPSAAAGIEDAATIAFGAFAVLCLVGAAASAVRGRPPAP
jgi:EmrB/QacA subfamily drug resistance transporter